MDKAAKRAAIYLEIENVCARNGKHGEARFELEDGLVIRRAEFVRAAAYYVRTIEAMDAGAYKE